MAILSRSAWQSCLSLSLSSAFNVGSGFLIELSNGWLFQEWYVLMKREGPRLIALFT